MERIAVVGAGLMGHGIAQAFAQAGFAVALHDPDPDVLATAPQRISANLEDLELDATSVDRVRLSPSLAEAVAEADVVFEAAPERLDVKRAVFTELERHAPRDAVLATNTSVIQIGQITASFESADRMLGTHWWNPPYLVPLVEVVPTATTAPDAAQRTIDLLRRAGKHPIRVERDVPGFIGNRLQHALWREAIALVAEGVCSAETVDEAVKASFGPRLAVMGPLETADLVGLDLTLDIHNVVIEHLDRTPGPAPYLRERVDAGDLGMKAGRGFRAWHPGAADDARRRMLRHLRGLWGAPKQTESKDAPQA